MKSMMESVEKAEYLRNPEHCPYCKSTDVAPTGVDGESLTQLVVCPDCQRQWTEIYTLTDVEV
jgi:transposase-like protein